MAGDEQGLLTADPGDPGAQSILESPGRAGMDRAIAPAPAPWSGPGLWRVLHTKSGQEKALAAALAAMAIAHYLPLVPETRFIGRRQVRLLAPLFAGYLFLKGALDDAYRADRTRRVAQIIAVADQQRLEWELRNIHRALSRQAPLDPHPYLREGVRVEVKAGPFRGLQGLVERRGGQAHRLVLQVQTLGRALSLEMDASLLVPA